MKILIISYYFNPCVGIAPNRATSCANIFSKTENVKVITRHWKGDEVYWKDYLDSDLRPTESIKISDSLEIHKTIYRKKEVKKNKISTFLRMLNGNLDYEIDATQLFEVANEVTENWRPDIIFITCPPLNLLKVADKLYEKYKIPFIVDFRDFENDVVLSSKKNISLKRKIQFFLIQKKVKSLLNNAKGICAINQNFIDYFERIKSKPSILIYNGFEKELFSGIIPVETIKRQNFIITIMGTIYQNQDYNFFLEAFRNSNLKIADNKIIFQFIGTDCFEDSIVADRIRLLLPKEKIVLTKRIVRSNALEYLNNSHLVWQPESPNLKGVFSGKIFEYLGAKRTILVGPSQNDVLDKLISETNSGYSFVNSEDLEKFIIEKYCEWEQKGYIEYKGIDDKIQFFSRDYQFEKLLSWIKTLI